MKPIISVISFSLIALCLVACSMSTTKTDAVPESKVEILEVPLSDEGVSELNEYLKPLTMVHLGDYDEEEATDVQLLNFVSSYLQVEYPTTVEYLYKDEETCLAFDKQLMNTVLEEYFNQDVEVKGIYTDLGDYVARVYQPIETDSIYPEVSSCQMNTDGTYTVHLKLYQTVCPLDDDVMLEAGWHESVNSHQVGVATVLLAVNGDSYYVMSYHPLYFE